MKEHTNTYVQLPKCETPVNQNECLISKMNDFSFLCYVHYFVSSTMAEPRSELDLAGQVSAPCIGIAVLHVHRVVLLTQRYAIFDMDGSPRHK